MAGVSFHAGGNSTLVERLTRSILQSAMELDIAVAVVASFISACDRET